MKKKIFSIWSVLLVLVISIAVVVPGCEGEGGEGTINVEATLCGEPWPAQGTEAVDYTLTPGTGSPTSGTEVPASFDVTTIGEWTCEDVSAPAGTFLVDITPNQQQTLADGGNITFTLNFEEEQDAWITFSEWTRNGLPWPYEPPWEMIECEILDVHFQQGVLGCPEYLAAVNETSRLFIQYKGWAPFWQGDILEPGLGQNVSLYVVNDDCAVNKTIEQLPDLYAEKVSQYTTLNGVYIDPGEYIPLTWDIETELDVETIWTLVKETNYIKSINWFGISYLPPFEPGGQHKCVLFELLVPPGPGWYVFDVSAEAEVVLMDDTDVNTTNDKDTSPPPPLQIWVWGGVL
jgi:hypothetical protein